jgi:hypothetical protein
MADVHSNGREHPANVRIGHACSRVALNTRKDADARSLIRVDLAYLGIPGCHDFWPSLSSPLPKSCLWYDPVDEQRTVSYAQLWPYGLVNDTTRGSY